MTNSECQVLQKKMEELQVQTDVSKQKHASKLEELSSAFKVKEDLIQNLRVKLKESEVGFFGQLRSLFLRLCG